MSQTMTREPACHPERIKLAYRYLNLIRNAAKRRYGFAYLAWLNGGAVGDEPERGALSYMAAQAVRIELATYKLWEA